MKGFYLLGYIETSDEKFLKSVDFVKKAVLNMCKLSGLNVVAENYHIFKGSSGFTYCFILSQSHFVIHTWPEKSRIFFDIFTCGKGVEQKKFVGVLSKEFNGTVKEIRKIEHK